MMRRRLSALRPIIRLAHRDAVRHRLRTMSAILLIALPVAAVSGLLVAMETQRSDLPDRQAALESIPHGAQAVVTGTAVHPEGSPLSQRPEGLVGWIDDPDVVPVDAKDVAGLVPAADEVHQYWTTGTLLATTGIDSEPGRIDAVDTDTGAGTGTGTAGLVGVETTGVATMTLTEADTDALELLLPAGGRLLRGAAPADNADIVITSAVAERTGADVGDEITVIAPPFSGVYSTVGWINEFLAGSQRGFRVSGVVDSDQDTAWARTDWVAATAQADPAGVDTRFLVTGPEAVTWEQVKRLNSQMAVVVSREVLSNYPSDAELYPVAVDPAAVALQVVIVMCAAAGAISLLLGMVTPALVVAVDQQRRTLALAAATGVRPRDLRRILTLQGVGTGVVGSLLGWGTGVAVGVGGLRATMPGRPAILPPAWQAILIVVLCAGAGWLATATAARRVSRTDLVASLKQRPNLDGRVKARGRWAGAAIALVAAVGCALASLRAPIAALEAGGSSGTPGPGGAVMVLMALAVLAAAVGLLLAVPVLVRAASSWAHRAPMALRLALREAGRRPARTAPVVGVVAVVVAFLSAGCVLVPAGAQHMEDTRTSLVGPGNLAIGVEVPVNDEIDAALLRSQAAALAGAGLPVTGTHPVYSLDLRGEDRRLLHALPAPGKECEEGKAPSIGSVLGRSEAVCVDSIRGYTAGYALPWWLGDTVLVLSAETMRATGVPGAEQAAQMLEEGGVVVNDATTIGDDGMVTVAVAGADGPLGTVEVAGYALPRLAASLVMTPQTLAGLGVGGGAPVYVGAILETSRDLTPAEVSRATDILTQRTDLLMVSAGRDAQAHPWGGRLGVVAFVVAALFALSALGVSLALARSQMLPDLVTMHAVGARPPFLRRVMVAHAAVVLCLGVPLGAVTGWSVGAYVMAWWRRIYPDGFAAWSTAPATWGMLAVAIVIIVGLGLAVARVVARLPRDLVRKRLE
ncbi:MAG: hypothetical protein Q4C85_07585 [Actinomyces sp.]|uniref:FtsX-like permease family protein n=1 Tax=Actinomyces sp. TaxID=29317 RepID=UPI0026DDC0E8|nr:FtsX-like permease family protein [Actinomyces sp.]MDO4243604.1 hypothetical protein [Actinomyces sp.]